MSRACVSLVLDFKVSDLFRYFLFPGDYSLFSAFFASGGGVEPLEEVGALEAGEDAGDFLPVFGFVPEEEDVLFFFFPFGAGAFDGAHGVGMEAGVVDFRGEGHGGGGEVLHLLEAEVQFFGGDGELGHVGERASGVGGDEVGDELLAQSGLPVDGVEAGVEFFEQGERGLAHESEDGVGGVFGGHFQSAGDVVADDRLEVGPVGGVGPPVARAVHREVVADAGADEAVFHAGDASRLFVEAQEAGVVGVHVPAYGGMEAGGAFASGAKGGVAPPHAVHVGRWAAEVGNGAPEVGHSAYVLDFPEDGFRRAGGDEFSLVGGDGAEGAAAEASAVHGDGVADHVVGGDFFAPVAGVGHAGEGEGVDLVEFLGGHRGVGGIDDEDVAAHFLGEEGGVEVVGLFFDAAEVGGLFAFVGEAFLVGGEGDGGPFAVCGVGLALGSQDARLGDVGEAAEGDAPPQHAA